MSVLSGEDQDQFSALNTGNNQYTTLLSLVSNNSLNFSQQAGASKASPYQPCPEQSMRSITYQQGAMYLASQDKGTILKCMLNEYNAQPDAKPITHVVFIDDTEKNVTNVEKAFAKSKKYTVYTLHYTKLKKHKKALTKGEMADVYQKNAMKRWRKIKGALEGGLMNPVVPLVIAALTHPTRCWSRRGRLRSCRASVCNGIKGRAHCSNSVRHKT